MAPVYDAIVRSVQRNDEKRRGWHISELGSSVDPFSRVWYDDLCAFKCHDRDTIIEHPKSPSVAT